MSAECTEYSDLLLLIGEDVVRSTDSEDTHLKELVRHHFFISVSCFGILGATGVVVSMSTVSSTG